MSEVQRVLIGITPLSRLGFSCVCPKRNIRFLRRVWSSFLAPEEKMDSSTCARMDGLGRTSYIDELSKCDQDMLEQEEEKKKAFLILYVRGAILSSIVSFFYL